MDGVEVMSDNTPPPKLFVSYSWSSPEHEEWVLQFATSLCESGVEVILDKWHLKEGHDAVAFMERMVSDPDIKKVAMVCDATYAAKANGRLGGVGTETQIISKEVYERQDQDKFVAVVTEKDADGKPSLPTYYSSRIYIDLSEPDSYSVSFERLVRWIFDRPLYVQPEIGKPPAYLRDESTPSLGTTQAFRRCVDALRNGRSHAAGSLDEYCVLFSENLDHFRISKADGEFDDAVVESVDRFLPYRNEAIELFAAVARYSSNPAIVRRLHRFFETLLPYIDRPANINTYKQWHFDNFRFIVHELFLYALAIFLNHERFEDVSHLLFDPYCIPEHWPNAEAGVIMFNAFWVHTQSFDYRKSRLNSNRYSLRADLLKERCDGTGIAFRSLMQADFVAFMRAEIETQNDWGHW